MNTEQYQKHLNDNSIGFDVKNNGLHLIVEGQNSLVDVWPTSGKWICRSTRQQGFGLRELLLYCTNGETLKSAKAPVQITLYHGTALWLRNVMQNPLWSSPEEEPEEDSAARAEIFKAVENVKP